MLDQLEKVVGSKFVFFATTLERTGGEVALYNLLSHSGLGTGAVLICKNKGALAASLEKMMPVRSFASYRSRIATRSVTERVISKIRRKPELGNFEDFLDTIAAEYPGRTWYVNTVWLPEVLQYARERNIPVILHAHELEQAAAALSAGQIALMVQYPALVIACSHGVADLFKVLGRKDHIAVCHPSLNTAVIRVNQARTGQLRKALNAGNRFVWAMSGSLTVNKNPLLFVEIANEIIQRGLSVCFVWVGGSHQSGAYWIARQQAAFYSIAHLVHWVGPQDDDYYNYLGMADGFVLTSTEESFSLVTLEAMYLKKPTVALYSKGPAEIIADGRMGVIAHSSRELIESMIAVMNGEREIDLAAAHERHLAFSALKSRTVWEQLLNEFSVQP